MAESIGAPDSIEGIVSFLDKRQVNFPPLGSGTAFAWMQE